MASRLGLDSQDEVLGRSPERAFPLRTLPTGHEAGPSSRSPVTRNASMVHLSHSDLKGTAQTVQGIIDPETLGATLMHDHLL